MQHGLCNCSGSLTRTSRARSGWAQKKYLAINIVVPALIKLFGNFSTQKGNTVYLFKINSPFHAKPCLSVTTMSLLILFSKLPKVESVIFVPYLKRASERERRTDGRRERGGKVNNNSSFINGWMWLSGDSFSNAVSHLSQRLLSNVYRATHAQIRSLKALITSEPSPLIFKIFFTLTSGKPI